MHVILVAHGPGPVTKRAVRRLRRVRSIEGLWVVAANQRSHRVGSDLAGATPVEGSGTAAVRTVASRLGDAPVLLLHDDVAITPAGVEGMLQMLRPGIDFVVPHSNEVGTPQFIGPLPPADEALGSLDRIRDLGPARRLSSARHSCLLGTGTGLASLGGTLVVPGGSLIRSQVTIMLAPVAAAHDLSCHSRLVAEGGDHPVIVASMIVRDEERTIEGAVRSVAGLVDRVEICDTGSIDSTVEIARSLGAVVRRIEWRDDFGWARNQALESCRDSDYFLMLDADERVVIDDAPLFRRWLRTWRDELQGVLVELRNHRGDGLPSSSHRALRVASTAGSRWHGALHESVRFDQPDAAVVFYGGLTIDHHGYTSSVVAEKNKAQRNIAISRAAYEAAPDPKTMIDYARSLRMQDDDDPEAEALFRRALEDVGPDAPAVVRSYLLATVAAYEMAAGRPGPARDLALEALGLTPLEDVALVTVGRAMSDAREWERLVGVWDDVSGRPSPSPMFAIDANARRFRLRVARALAAVGRFAESARLLTEVLAAGADAIADTVREVIPDVIADGLDPELLAGALAADRDGIAVEAMSRAVSPAQLAEVAIAALEAGGDSGRLFTTAFAASLIRPGTDLPDRLVRHAHLAPVEHRPALAGMASRRGRPDLAPLFETTPDVPLVLSGDLFG
jgi:hypothetical protein